MHRVSLALTIVSSALALPGVLQAQDAKVQIIKLEIARAKQIEQKFAAGLKHCNSLDGNHAFMEKQNRVVNLDDLHKSLQNLAKDHVFNPAKKRAWTTADAEERWQMAKKVAAKERSDCAMVAKLPALQKELHEAEAKAR